ncbi:uncharacterized protein LOC108598118 [Drosophila busckii]|uniref:uncharacterized protein LOC108598118 n=1 Tax=Drosophila busckii TaxID=30019 RepID=UPI00083F19A4|nr:uncharacterized protein LOC108598118 [Drosophila busckii]
MRCFKKCELKMIRRGVAAFSMYAAVYKLPVKNVYANLELHRRSNGYKPFLFNQSLDYCFYMRNPKAYAFINSIHDTFLNYSNMNHTCPYNHDIIINDMEYGKNSFNQIPLPNGEYILCLKLAVSKVWVAEIKLYFSRLD